MEQSSQESPFALRVRIRGDVQCVGFRYWTMTQARQRGLSGWVRNRHDGSVEALFCGSQTEVEAMAEACRRGPRSARVDSVRVETVPPSVEPGFDMLPDA